MAATAAILGLWAAFGATHMGLSNSRLRPALVERLGEKGFVAVYSLIALATFIPLVSVYFGAKHSGPKLWYLGGIPGARWLAYAGIGVAFAMMVAGLVRSSPSSLVPGEANPTGVFRITRHPVFMGVGLLGLLHLLVVPIHAAELAFFGGLPFFSVIGCHHQDRRKLVSLGEGFRSFHDRTPFLPGTRRGALRGVAEQPIPMLIGLAVAAVLRHYHSSLFG
ncbi:MAG: NnrU family protein [Myxococcota bacterium]